MSNIEEKQKFVGMMKTVYDMSPKPLRNKLDKIPDELFSLSPDELEQEVFGSDRTVIYKKKARVLNFLRYRLHDHVRRTMAEGSFDIDVVLNGVCTNRYFYNKVCDDPARMLWIFTPPEDYYSMCNNLLNQSINAMQEILNTNLNDQEHRAYMPLLGLKFKIFKEMNSIVNGLPIARTVNVNKEVTSIVESQVAEMSSMEDIQKEIGSLQRQKEKVIDVTPEEE